MAGNGSLLQKAILTDAYGNELSYREDFNIIYLSINQIQASLAPPSADPQGYWHECALNHGRCTSTQIEFLQGEFRFGLTTGSNEICIHGGPTNHAYLFPGIK